MTQTLREQDGRLVIELGGEIDLDRAPEVRKLLLEGVARERDVLVDLSRVTYIDSSGIACLIEALQSAGKLGTGLALVAVSPEARRVLELARLDTVFVLHPDMTAAMAAGN